MERDTQGDRIRALFEDAEGEVVVIAPFIKVDALRSLLEVIPAGSQLRCVTRWLPKDIAAGVSDPEILDLLEIRGNFNLFLVDRLHAKLYINGNRCLAGSVNLTLAGLGEIGESSNIEILVETTVHDPGIAATLAAISEAERPATRHMAETVRRLADSLSNPKISAVALDAPWFPLSRRPEQAYKLYMQPPVGFVGAAERSLIADLANSNIQPGLDEKEFRQKIRSLLAEVEIAEDLLESSEDTILTRADANTFLETISGENFSANDLWSAFVNWMVYFYPDLVMKHEIAEIALRRARLLD